MERNFFVPSSFIPSKETSIDLSKIVKELTEEINNFKKDKWKITSNKIEINNQIHEIECLKKNIVNELKKLSNVPLTSLELLLGGGSPSPSEQKVMNQTKPPDLKDLQMGMQTLGRMSKKSTLTKVQGLNSQKMEGTDKIKKLYRELALEEAHQKVYQQILESQSDTIEKLNKFKAEMQNKLTKVKVNVASELSKNEEKKLETRNLSTSPRIFSISTPPPPPQMPPPPPQFSLFLPTHNLTTSNNKAILRTPEQNLQSCLNEPDTYIPIKPKTIKTAEKTPISEESVKQKHAQMEKRRGEKVINDFLTNKLHDIITKINKGLKTIDFSENQKKLVASIGMPKFFELRKILINKDEVSKFINASEQCTATLKSIAKEIINQENLAAQRTLEAQKKEEEKKRVNEEIKRAEAKKIEEERKAAERQKLLLQLDIVKPYVNPDDLINKQLQLQLQLEKNTVLKKEDLDKHDLFLKNVDFKLKDIGFKSKNVDPPSNDSVTKVNFTLNECFKFKIATLPQTAERTTAEVDQLNREVVAFEALLIKVGFDYNLNNIHDKNQALLKKGYSEAAEEAWSIYEKLTSNKKKLLEQKINVNQFVELCNEVIDSQKTKNLSEHRGILKYIAVILIVFSFLIKTDSMKIVDDIRKILDTIKDEYEKEGQEVGKVRLNL
ncbi:hypothetical protein [Legionella sp.]|uniref:hypothetical protein n=1 Tax=Legionella sp. TaxID=459 RepID=UPI003C8AD516